MVPKAKPVPKVRILIRIYWATTLVREILGFAEAPAALSGTGLRVYNHHVDRTPDMMVGLTANQRYDMGIFVQKWEQNKDRYEEVSAATNMPAELIAALHWREGSGNFNTYLHQGDPFGKTGCQHPQ